ncbi:MAG: hypothetical protein BGO07_04955 [Alphaproteobacteria bacterium 40-19]|nr:MAG: hypothetical protein BGO07_04955 [Alphaproteobacteria bacterium 40-19]
MFQSAVQATSFEEKYQDCIKNKDNDAAEKIAKQIQEMKDLGVDPQTKIVDDPSQASTIAESYVYFLTTERVVAVEFRRSVLKNLKDLGISSTTKIKEFCLNIGTTSSQKQHVFTGGTLAEQYLTYAMFSNLRTDMEAIAQKIRKLQSLGISADTKIVYNPSQASTIAEAYAYYLINKRENFANKTEKHIQEMQDLGISVNTNIVRPLNDNLSLEDKYVHYIINTDFEAAEKTAKEIRYRNFVTKTRSQMDDVLGNFKILTKEVEEKQKNLQNIENQKDDLLEKIKQLTDQVKEEKQTLKQLTDQVKEEKQKLKTIETEAENTSNFFKKLAAQIGTDKKQTFWQKIKNFFLGDPNTKLQAKLPDDLNILISTKLEYLEAVKKAISAGEKKLEKEKLSKSNTFKNLGKIEEK